MDRDALRRQTCIIIRKHGHFLKGRDMLTMEIAWTWSAYEAWKTRDMEEAREVARETGGVMMLFNPVVNQKKLL